MSRINLQERNIHMNAKRAGWSYSIGYSQELGGYRWQLWRAKTQEELREYKVIEYEKGHRLNLSYWGLHNNIFAAVSELIIAMHKVGIEEDIKWLNGINLHEKMKEYE